MGPAFFGMGVYQMNLFVDTIFATSSRMPTGSITSLYVADRVMQLVLGSYAIAMSTVILPTMSHQIAAGKWDEMKHTFGFSLRIVSFITIPAAVGLILLRRPIMQVLFQHGQFVAESTALTAHALLFYSLGLPAYRGDQADHADVLLDAGYVDAGARGRVGAGRQHRAQRDFPAVFLSLAFEREPGAGEFACGVFQFRRAVFAFPQALRSAWGARSGCAR